MLCVPINGTFHGFCLSMLVLQLYNVVHQWLSGANGANVFKLVGSIVNTSVMACMIA